jgi:hypothetical protein
MVNIVADKLAIWWLVMDIVAYNWRTMWLVVHTLVYNWFYNSLSTGLQFATGLKLGGHGG